VGVITHGTPAEVTESLALGNVLATSLGLSLLGNRGLAAKDILLNLAGGCFWELGHKLDSLGTLEVRQMRR